MPGLCGIEPVPGTIERVLPHRQDSAVGPGHQSLVLVGKRVGRVIGPLGLANDRAVKHQVLLAKEFQNGRDVDESDAEARGGGKHPPVAGADIGSAGLQVAAHFPHGAHPSAYPPLRFDDAHVNVRILQVHCGAEAGEARADHHRFAAMDRRHADSALQSEGRGPPGRPERQQSAGQ